MESPWNPTGTRWHSLCCKVFRTAEYFLCDPETRQVEGLRLSGRSYRPIKPDGEGRVWSEQLGVSLGLWHGKVDDREGDWIRLYRPDGSLVPTPAEAERTRAEAERRRAEDEFQRAEAERLRADSERRQAEAERQRAEVAEAEVARLRARLEENR